MSTMSIKHGLFSGTVIPSEELEQLLDANNQVVTDRNGQPRTFWPAHCRTPRILEKFSPLDGFAIEVTSVEAPYRLTDKYYDASGNPVLQPSRLFTAKLVKEGSALATATILQPIFGPWAVNLGEQIARGALYDALGLGLPMHVDLSSGKTGEPAQAVVEEPIAATEAPAAPAPAEAPAPAAALLDPVPVATAPAPAQPSAVTPIQVSPSRPKAPGINDHIEKNLLQTIEIQSAAKGITVPTFKDTAAAKAFLQDLLKGNLPPQGSSEQAA
ncbi:MAG: hypothetical protein A2X76_10980 [Lysobacterales bacterium GWF1_69_6]|nr:MAG: hypothetical protein A2X76_10980 [Xanthomonadales bacterium GWF1_69_6]